MMYFKINYDIFIVPYGPWWSHLNEFSDKKNVFIINYEQLKEVDFDLFLFFLMNYITKNIKFNFSKIK